jgi:hypothetical protein
MLRIILSVCFLGFILPGSANAASVPIVNAGFEDIALVDGGFTSSAQPESVAMPGWVFLSPTSGSDYGSWNPTVGDLASQTYEGQNVAYHGVGSFQQALTTNRQPSMHYVLTVQQSLPSAIRPTAGTWKIELRAGASVIGDATGNIADLTRGVYMQRTVTFDSPETITPEPLCVVAASGGILSKTNTSGKELAKLSWNALASATDQSDFGDPVDANTAASVCLYDDDDVLVGELSVARAGQDCGTRPCWKRISTKGYLYSDKAAGSDGVAKLASTSGAAGKGKAQLIGRNNPARGQTSLPAGIAAVLSGNTSATAQLQTTDGFCASVRMNSVKKDTGSLYIAQRRK